MARELCASSRSSSKPSVCWLLRQYMAPSLNFSNCRTYMTEIKRYHILWIGELNGIVQNMV
jgi:hypothetical protein